MYVIFNLLLCKAMKFIFCKLIFLMLFSLIITLFLEASLFSGYLYALHIVWPSRKSRLFDRRRLARWGVDSILVLLSVLRVLGCTVHIQYLVLGAVVLYWDFLQSLRICEIRRVVACASGPMFGVVRCLSSVRDLVFP